ncbi:hypothetical protein [Novimethylophilus kurashikiensis]|uniref:hypothetical protein n=1 Tax=Novimethylophilus kurashikiensis TaxID=1825523 RepID=UPI0011B1DB98|nr:hypothetical protein [Novimethylophilus kurashikiensis]
MHMHLLSGKRTTNAAANSYLAASNLLNLAREQDEGSFYWAMASVVFSAFTYEAFLNVIGEEVLGRERWVTIDRAGWMRKHSTIFAALSLQSNLSCPPESTLIELFDFRNLAKFHPHCSPNCIPECAAVASCVNQQFQTRYPVIA